MNGVADELDFEPLLSGKRPLAEVRDAGSKRANVNTNSWPDALDGVCCEPDAQDGDGDSVR